MPFSSGFLFRWCERDAGVRPLGDGCTACGARSGERTGDAPVCTGSIDPGTFGGVHARHPASCLPTRRCASNCWHPGAHTRWLFPSPKAGHALPISPAAVNSVLLRACKSANIRGRHCHSHAVRKFVVCRLMSARNRLGAASALQGKARAGSRTWPNGWGTGRWTRRLPCTTRGAAQL
jgi:hypothetical protein